MAGASSSSHPSWCQMIGPRRAPCLRPRSCLLPAPRLWACVSPRLSLSAATFLGSRACVCVWCCVVLVAKGGASERTNLGARALAPASPGSIFIHAYVWGASSAFLCALRREQYLNGLMQRLQLSPETYIRAPNHRCGFLDAQQVNVSLAVPFMCYRLA